MHQGGGLNFWAVNLLEGFENDRVPSIAPSAKADYNQKIRIAKEPFKTQDVRVIQKLDLINYKNRLEASFKWKPRNDLQLGEKGLY
jgi:hypothetical protein